MSFGKLTNFLVGIILIGFFAVVFGSFMSNMGSTYGVSYDNSSFESYQSLEKMANLSKEIEQSSDIEEKTGVLDIIGNYFTGAYKVLVLAKESFTTFNTMTQESIENSNLGAIGGSLRLTISSLILVIIVLGVIIAAIMKWYV